MKPKDHIESLEDDIQRLLYILKKHNEMLSEIIDEVFNVGDEEEVEIPDYLPDEFDIE